MPPLVTSPAPAVLDREFLTLRTRLLDLGAGLDRVDRGEGSAAGDPRLAQIREALLALADGQPGRAERVQMIFSLPYDERWQTRS